MESEKTGVGDRQDRKSLFSPFRPDSPLDKGRCAREYAPMIVQRRTTTTAPRAACRQRGLERGLS